MIAAQRHSGLVLGAYHGKRMIGVLFGFTAMSHGRPYHYSHITGVRKSFQARGVGYGLKLAQRGFVMDQGMSLVRWTFDPLQAGNGFFNIAKLGAVCRTYVRNLYGNLRDSLNHGRITDRFEVEWWIRSPRVRQSVSGLAQRLVLDRLLEEGVEVVNRTKVMKSGVRRTVRTRLGLRHGRLLVEVPESIVRVRDASREASRAWTLSFRRIFEHYFRRGYVVTNVVVDGDLNGRRTFYLLESDVGQSGTIL